MTTILITTGLACIIAAIVGGGLKAFNIEVPALHSTTRQIMLAIFGVALLVASSRYQDSLDTNATKATTPVSAPSADATMASKPRDEARREPEAPHKPRQDLIVRNSNWPCILKVDGNSAGVLPADGTKKISVERGKHLIECFNSDTASKTAGNGGLTIRTFATGSVSDGESSVIQLNELAAYIDDVTHAIAKVDGDAQILTTSCGTTDLKAGNGFFTAVEVVATTLRSCPDGARYLTIKNSGATNYLVRQTALKVWGKVAGNDVYFDIRDSKPY
jgi:hypothetical protein